MDAAQSIGLEQKARRARTIILCMESAVCALAGGRVESERTLNGSCGAFARRPVRASIVIK